MCQKCQKQNPDNAGLIKIKSVVASPAVDFVERTSPQPRRIRQACQGCHQLALLDASERLCVSCLLKQYFERKARVKEILKLVELLSVDSPDESVVATNQNSVLQEIQGVLQALTRHHERLYHFHLSSSAGFPEVIQKGEQYIKALNGLINSLEKQEVK
ncbi:hypothetical protein [Pasteurella multocida]|uniref:hypothetical protein n=1 Tax=Pasteurella multocida TaxID=747 RepID=UPI0021C20344|nr:hypothetical protein [Pasteurella multocida]MCT8984571.1 hypothetical protein [Pasteurella multocida]